MTYTPGDITRLTHIPPSSLRRYVDLVGHLLSYTARLKRGRRFTDGDMALLIQVRDVVAAGTPLKQVADQVKGLQQPAQPDQENTSLLIVARRLEVVDKEFDQQRQDIAELRRRLEALEAQQAQRPPWWKRIFRKV